VTWFNYLYRWHQRAVSAGSFCGLLVPAWGGWNTVHPAHLCYHGNNDLWGEGHGQAHFTLSWSKTATPDSTRSGIVSY